MQEMFNWSSGSSMNFSGRETISVRKNHKTDVSQVLDLKDFGEMGIEILHKDYSRTWISSNDSAYVLSRLKDQIRNRPDPLDRSEHWEGYSVQVGVFKNAPTLEGHIYSFDREMRVLLSRMTTDERVGLGWNKEALP